METHWPPSLTDLGRDQAGMSVESSQSSTQYVWQDSLTFPAFKTVQDDFPLLSLLMSEEMWPFNNHLVHSREQSTKALFVVKTQPQPRPLLIGFGILHRFTSFTYPKLLDGFERSQDLREPFQGPAASCSSDSTSPWDTSSEQSSICGTEVDAVEAKDDD